MSTSANIHPTTKTTLLSPRAWALILLLLTPALLCSNMIVARAVADIIPPFTLAFTRWLVAVLVLLPFIGVKLWAVRGILAAEWKQLLLLGFLGMGICGAFPYLGAKTTTATNIGLIYALSPIFIILFARLWYQEQLNKRQLLGVLFAFAGVLVIVAKGDWQVLAALNFTVGDLWILAASASWGFYSLWQGHLKTRLSLFLRFAAMSVGGVIALAPFAALEIYQQLPLVLDTAFMNTFVITIAFLAIISSISAYAAYAHIQKILGASKASLVMYAIPLYNAAMAWLFLDEQLQSFHLLGALLILPGLFLAVSKRKA
ncbi:MAG: DMT family transporter [Pseudomonadales bacterium]|nr:DMT family transporter [Pseudomonadales bacterium]NRA14840.1 DMT family transporter [Oceanospirillaceae bacterium]